MLTTIKNYFFKHVKNPIVIIAFVFVTAITLFLYTNNRNNQQHDNTQTAYHKELEQVEKIPETEETKAKKKTLLEKINEINEKIAVTKNQSELDKLAAEKEQLVKEYQKLEAQTT